MTFEVKCFSYDVALGAILGQIHDKILHPIHYVSKMLNAKKNYTLIKQELLAVVSSLRSLGLICLA